MIQADTFSQNLVVLLFLDMDGQRPQVLADLEKNELSFHITPAYCQQIKDRAVAPVALWERAEVTATIRPTPSREKVQSRGTLSYIPLTGFVSKMLLFYYRYLRTHYAGRFDGAAPSMARNYVLYTTHTGRKHEVKDITSALKRSCQWALGDRSLQPDSRSMRRVIATLMFHKWQKKQMFATVRTRREFFDLVAARLNTGVESLKRIYISEGLVAPLSREQVIPYNDPQLRLAESSSDAAALDRFECGVEDADRWPVRTIDDSEDGGGDSSE